MACRPNAQISWRFTVHGEDWRTFEDRGYKREAVACCIGKFTSVPEQVGSSYQEDNRYVAEGTRGIDRTMWRERSVSGGEELRSPDKKE